MRGTFPVGFDLNLRYNSNFRKKISLLLTITTARESSGQNQQSFDDHSTDILELRPPGLAGVHLVIAVTESVERIQGQTWCFGGRRGRAGSSNNNNNNRRIR